MNWTTNVLEDTLPDIFKWNDFIEKKDVNSEIENISKILETESKHNIMFPPIENVFRSLREVKPKDIKVVLLGQDPYHNGNACGLSFSIENGQKINPSLKNIYLELEMSGFKVNKNGNISFLTKQGVLLLNTSLTVIKGNPNSHKYVWRNFTKMLIQFIDENIENVEWLLFGAEAHKYIDLIKNGKYYCTSHPSPFSYRKSCGQYPAFLGSDVFKKLNTKLYFDL